MTSGTLLPLRSHDARAVQRRAVGFPEGPVRAEMEAFEYEPTRTGVRYAAPEGAHDDRVVALALAVERARTGAPPSVLVCNPGAALATAWEPAGLPHLRPLAPIESPPRYRTYARAAEAARRVHRSRRVPPWSVHAARGTMLCSPIRPDARGDEEAL